MPVDLPARSETQKSSHSQEVLEFANAWSEMNCTFQLQHSLQHQPSPRPEPFAAKLVSAKAPNGYHMIDPVSCLQVLEVLVESNVISFTDFSLASSDLREGNFDGSK